MAPAVGIYPSQRVFIVKGLIFSLKRALILCIFATQFVPVMIATRPALSEPVIFDHSTAQELLGRHNLTLKWPDGRLRAIGETEITKNDNGDWRLTGRQITKDTRVELDGKIVEVDAISFKFSGKIVIRIQQVADGKACSRRGPFTFVRNVDYDVTEKSWRLLQADNPCGTAVDSVDLYLQ